MSSMSWTYLKHQKVPTQPALPDILGHVNSGEEIRTEARKVGAIQTYPTPQNLKGLHFIGLAGWYHRFIPCFSKQAALLHTLKKKGMSWKWTEEHQAAFEDFHSSLTLH